MRKNKLSLAPFVKAWEMLIDISLPASFKTIDDDADSEIMLFNFPVVGACVGILAYVIAWILNIVPGAPMGPFLAGIVITLLLELIVSGRSMSALISFVELVGRYTIGESLAAMNDEFNVQRSSTGTLLLVSFFLIRILCFSFIIQHGCTFWLIIVLTVNYGTQAYFAASTDMRSGEPFFDLNPQFDRNIWLITAALMLVAGITYFPVVAVTLALVIFSAYRFRIYCDTTLGGMSANIIGFGGYIAEFIALLIGLTFLVR